MTTAIQECICEVPDLLIFNPAYKAPQRLVMLKLSRERERERERSWKNQTLNTMSVSIIAICDEPTQRFTQVGVQVPQLSTIQTRNACTAYTGICSGQTTSHLSTY